MLPAEEFPRALYARAAEAGVLGLSYPETSAGPGATSPTRSSPPRR
jgi:alkylation response protein AidB-like acyl-CoA dehydrogenase